MPGEKLLIKQRKVEMLTRYEIQKARQSVKLILAWDFIASGGDTIKENCESLLSLVTGQCLQKNESLLSAIVIASNSICGMLTSGAMCTFGEQFVPVFKSYEKGLTHAFRYNRSCGPNGYNTNFDCIEDELFTDEILVINGDKVTLIKIFNNALA